MTTRRRFLQSAALAAAASTLRAQSPRIQLGLASYTFRGFTRAQLIQSMRQLRIDALNAKDVRDHLPASPSEEATALADYTSAGIRLHAAGTIDLSEPDEAANEAVTRGKFEYCKRAGVSTMVAGDPLPRHLPRLATFARQYDMRIAIHNHGPEDPYWHSPLDILAAVKDLDSRLGCCIDVGHCARAGVSPIEAIHAAGPRLFNMHMKDLASFKDKESQVAVGDGIMPVRGIFAALIASGYTGFVDLEYEIHPDDPMPGVIRSFAAMRRVLAAMV